MKKFFHLFFILLASCLFEPLDRWEILYIPTYDGSNQAVHPSIITHNNTFFLAFTPFPYSQDEYENPSLLQSNDGRNFYEIPNCPAPIVNTPGGDGYNNDPDVYYDKNDSTMNIIYQETFIGIHQKIINLKSKDLKNWTCEDLIVEKFDNKSTFSVSPAIVLDSLYHMFYVDIYARKIKIINVANLSNCSFDQSIDLNIDIKNLTPWHIDVIEDDDVYYMLISGYPDNFNYQNLYIAKSTDLNNWSFRSKPLISQSEFIENTRSLYRSTGLVDSKKLIVYFSFETYDNEWKIARKEFNIEDLF
ncbi:MAG: hypothetical protein JXR48_17960 [Candidatus Delongbacteria bacterium]|nr:hypothetical protein [Candidatus Delongbacteria bacterium]MBN2836845.1 hypothetical protein [Candidatus Delongbacteria bacterium]